MLQLCTCSYDTWNKRHDVPPFCCHSNFLSCSLGPGTIHTTDCGEPVCLKSVMSLAAAVALANMPALKLLDLSDNGLTGTLPADWSGASNLVILLLDNNTFTGALGLTPSRWQNALLHHPATAATPRCTPCPTAILYAAVCTSPGFMLRADRSLAGCSACGGIHPEIAADRHL